MNMSESMNERFPTVSERIERFLQAVDQALTQSGTGADERRNIAADLRVQIEEMLAQRAANSGKEASLDDVEAVLAALDPPESYSEAAPEKEAENAGRDEPARRQHSCGRGGRHRGGGGPRWLWRRRHVAHALRQAIHSFGPFGHPAFQGMTDRMRTALGLAKNEARRLRHDFIGTEHMLLGLLLEGTGIAAITLNRLGLDAQWARQEAERLIPAGIAAGISERLPLTPRLRQAIEDAHAIARKLGADFLGTEHLLLAIIDIPGVAAQIITNRGLSAEQVREETLRQIQSASPASQAAHGMSPQPIPAPFTYWPASAIPEIKIGSNAYKIIAGGNDTGGAFAAIEEVIASPDGLGSRVHTREDISVHVLEGSVRLHVGERTVELRKGDFSRIPRGTPHEIYPSDAPARIMVLATPAGCEKLIGELSAASGAEAIRQAAQRYGVMQ
jgi:mannose-6-phosphate isomerase-like protein (cupin superfamily)